VYLVFGVLTLAIGIATLFFLVDSPHSKWLRLTEEEEEIVELRTQDNAVVMERTVKVAHYWESVKEVRFYLVILASFCNNLSNGGLVVFSTPFVATLGFQVQRQNKSVT
jgi:ACS family allantoate permease-like MFS transporter